MSGLPPPQNHQIFHYFLVNSGFVFDWSIHSWDIRQIEFALLRRVFLNECVLEYIWHPYTSLRVNVEHSPNQILGFGGQLRWHCEVSCFDFKKEISDVFVVERKMAGEQSEEDNSTGPDVAWCTVIRLASHDLGTRIMRGPTRCFEQTPFWFQDCHAKVCNPDIPLFIEEEVFRLQISVTSVSSASSGWHTICQTDGNRRRRR